MYHRIEDFDQFIELKNISRDSINPSLIGVARNFSELEEMEDLITIPLVEPNQTPHGPAEISDIFTLRLSYNNKFGLAAFVLKGRSFKTVKAKDISHQIYRLRKIADLKYAFLGFVGNILDPAKEEFIQTATDLNIDYSVLDVIDFARLAIMNGLICPKDAKKIKNGKCECGYRVKGNELNYLQKEALKSLNATRQFSNKSGVVVLPTGSGKTRVAVTDAKKLNSKKILYVAHTHEILDSAESEFAHIYGKINIKRNNFNKIVKTPEVHLGTIQSLRSKLSNASQYDYVIIDEFHHAAANSYKKLIFSIEPEFLLGLTATPFRGDRQDVIELCDGNIVVEFELRSGIDGNILSPYHYYGCFDNVDYTQLRYTNKYSIRDLNKALIIPERDEAIINKWREVAEDLPTLAFCCSIEHAKRTAKAFNNSDIQAETYIGTTDYHERQRLLEEFRFGNIKVLCVVDVLNEGIDIPFIECVLFLRPTESKRIFLQQLGRGLRKFPGKDKLIVLDFIGNFHNSHKIVDYFGLDPDETPSFMDFTKNHTLKDILNLPIGCEIFFEDKVMDLFAKQILNARKATRSNIAQILIYEYRKTSLWLGRPATKREVDRYQLLHTELFKLAFGSWRNFENIISEDNFISKLL